MASMGEDPRVEAAFRELLRAQDRGEAPDPETWVSAQPTEIRTALRAYLRVMGLLGGPPAPAGRAVPESLPKFDRYSGLRLVGRGGMGAVYRADDEVLGRVVALKAMHPDLAADPARVARFLDEARVASQLQHPNIVPVYDAGTMPGEPDRPYFTMRLVAPRTLADATAEYHALPPGPARDAARNALLRQFIAVCGAVAYAHDRGVLHRDLKPQNVMVGAFDEVQVMDWGLSKLLSPGGDAPDPDGAVRTGRGTESVAGAVRGTPAYMPPEQAAGDPVGPPADVFALGAVLCHVLTGRPVYGGATTGEVLAAAAACDPAPVLARLAGADAPPELVALVRRCLSKAPGDRPGSAAEVGSEVAGYLALAEQRVREAELSRVRAEEQAAGDRRRRRWQLAAVAGGLALVFGAVAAGIWLRFDREARRLEDQARAADEERKESDRRLEEERQTSTRAADVGVAVAEMYAALDQDRFGAAAAALQRAKGRLGLDPPADLADRVAEADRHRAAVVALDEIRQEQAVLRARRHQSTEYTARKFADQFAALGCDPNHTEAVARIAASPIRRTLVIALDSWATGSVSEATARRLLEVARGADPDPGWADRFRDPAVRRDPAALAALASAAPIDRLTVSQAEALVNILPEGDPAANRLIRAAVAKYPDQFWVNLAAARWLSTARTGSFETDRSSRRTAIAHARSAAVLRPGSEAALMFLCLLYQAEALPDALDDLAAQAANLGRDTWMRRLILARAARIRQKYPEEVEHLTRAVQLAPGEDQLVVELAAHHLSVGKPKPALELVEPVLARHPEHLNAMVVRAASLLALGRRDEADALLLQVLRLDPAYQGGRMVLAASAQVRGRLGDAEVLLRGVESDLGNDITVLPLRAYQALARGDVDDALTHSQRAVEMCPHPNTWLLRALSLRAAGRTRDALAAAAEWRRLLDENRISGSLMVGGLVPNLQVQFNAHTVRDFIRYEEEWNRTGLPYVKEDKLREMQKNPLLALLCPNFGDSLLVNGLPGVAVRYYEAGLPRGSILGKHSHTLLMWPNRINAARAGALAWAGKGRDAVKTTDEDRARALKLALGWLKEEVDWSRQVSARPEGAAASVWDGGTPSTANRNLHVMRMHRDLAPLRDPVMIAEMPEEERKLARELWAEVDELLKKLNPPLDVPGIEGK